MICKFYHVVQYWKKFERYSYLIQLSKIVPSPAETFEEALREQEELMFRWGSTNDIEINTHRVGETQEEERLSDLVRREKV